MSAAAGSWQGSSGFVPAEASALAFLFLCVSLGTRNDLNNFVRSGGSECWDSDVFLHHYPLADSWLREKGRLKSEEMIYRTL